MVSVEKSAVVCVIILLLGNFQNTTCNFEDILKLAEIMGAGLFKHFKPKKTRKNVQGKNDNVPAENQTLNLAEALVEVSEGSEKYTILSYGQKPSLEQIQAANKEWFNDNDDKCEVSENFDVTTTTRQEKIRFSEPLVTFIMTADKYDRNTSTVFSQIQFLGEMAEMQEQQEKSNEIT